MSFSGKISYSKLEEVSKSLKCYDSIACHKLINIIGKEEFENICKGYLDNHNKDYRMFILNNEAYENKGYSLNFSSAVGTVFEEYEVFFLEECIDYARETNIENIDYVVELVTEYIQSLIKAS